MKQQNTLCCALHSACVCAWSGDGAADGVCCQGRPGVTAQRADINSGLRKPKSQQVGRGGGAPRAGSKTTHRTCMYAVRHPQNILV